MTCWIGVASAEHVRAGVEGSFAMFAHGRHNAVKRVKPGDGVTYYSPREGMKEGAVVRAFTAIGNVLDGDPRERVMAQQLSGWSRSMRWLDSRPADIYPLLDRLSFVKDRSHWGMYFRKSLFSIPDSDFALIADAMGADLN